MTSKFVFMEHLEDSSDRGPFDLTLFGIAFCAFLVGAAGVVLAVPSIAILGGTIMLLSILIFFVRSLL